MDDLPIAKARRQARQEPYDSTPLVTRVEELLKINKDSFREASLKSGLDHQAIRRIRAGFRPRMEVCILLADHFGVNPNELLELAGWPKLRAFDIQTDSAESLPVEAVTVAKEIAKISNPKLRKAVSEAILTLVKQHFDAE